MTLSWRLPVKSGPEVAGDGLGGVEGGGGQLPGTEALPQFEGGLDLGDFRRPKAGGLQQVLDVGAIDPAEPPKVPQDRKGDIVGVLPGNTPLERPSSDAKDDGQQLGVRQPRGPLGEEPLARSLLYGPAFDPFRTHDAFPNLR